jgi:glutaconyl-CoA/methylmalonyl-CoA decarboxylase subunit gamma
MKRLKVTVDGKAYDVNVEVIDEIPGAGALISALPAPAPVASVPAVAPAAVVAPIAAAAPKPQASGTGDVISPLAGKLVSIEVKVGQEIQEGARVATVEAMKMNTYIYAPKAGKIASVQVNPGEAVDEGSVILCIA